ncbi:hypothetical protein [Amycolatopsis sp. PS_44_ISF1]|uniref:hypothetical protein n=1 Tax=Amycolatopsis sp. PS_44_ISF1 TaxID=2974917 RepID=UPI0028DF867B|nr:hypothetical protein [Amycolatopsis sp. PS_44_ISF1]MDT8916233.1 hypothetical protein [Amycolatopsis sp. PS_44_ISF1]
MNSNNTPDRANVITLATSDGVVQHVAPATGSWATSSPYHLATQLRDVREYWGAEIDAQVRRIARDGALLLSAFLFAVFSPVAPAWSLVLVGALLLHTLQGIRGLFYLRRERAGAIRALRAAKAVYAAA